MINMTYRLRKIKNIDKTSLDDSHLYKLKKESSAFISEFIEKVDKLDVDFVSFDKDKLNSIIDKFFELIMDKHIKEHYSNVIYKREDFFEQVEKLRNHLEVKMEKLYIAYKQIA